MGIHRLFSRQRVSSRTFRHGTTEFRGLNALRGRRSNLPASETRLNNIEPPVSTPQLKNLCLVDRASQLTDRAWVFSILCACECSAMHKARKIIWSCRGVDTWAPFAALAKHRPRPPTLSLTMPERCAINPPAFTVLCVSACPEHSMLTQWRALGKSAYHCVSWRPRPRDHQCYWCWTSLT